MVFSSPEMEISPLANDMDGIGMRKVQATISPSTDMVTLKFAINISMLNSKGKTDIFITSVMANLSTMTLAKKCKHGSGKMKIDLIYTIYEDSN